MMFALTLSFSIIATLATDSRSATIIVFLVPILYMISYKKVNIKKTMIVGTIALVVLANLDSVTYYIRNKTQFCHRLNLY